MLIFVGIHQFIPLQLYDGQWKVYEQDGQQSQHVGCWNMMQLQQAGELSHNDGQWNYTTQQGSQWQAELTEEVQYKPEWFML